MPKDQILLFIFNLILLNALVFIMFDLLAKVPMVEVSMFFNLGPIVGVVLGLLILKEAIAIPEICVGALAFCSCALVILGNYYAA